MGKGVKAVDIVLIGCALAAPVAPLIGRALHFEHPLHAPATAHATLRVAATSVSTPALASEAAFDCNPFRVYYAQSIETLTDDVSRYRPAAPVTYVV